ncbi:hypothetical protein Hanom_Chr09g00858741 [Helianthus anomalus]
MGCIVLLVDLELSRSVSYNLVSLHEDTAKTKVRSITIDNEVIASVGQCKNWCMAQHVFEGLESSLLCSSPHERLVFMSKRGKRHSNLRESFNESSVVTC